MFSLGLSFNVVSIGFTALISRVLRVLILKSFVLWRLWLVFFAFELMLFCASVLSIMCLCEWGSKSRSCPLRLYYPLFFFLQLLGHWYFKATLPPRICLTADPMFSFLIRPVCIVEFSLSESLSSTVFTSHCLLKCHWLLLIVFHFNALDMSQWLCFSVFQKCAQNWKICMFKWLSLESIDSAIANGKWHTQLSYGYLTTYWTMTASIVSPPCSGASLH